MRTEHNYIRVYTGRKFWPLDPSEEDVHYLDIAHALGNLCRYTGHTQSFYSVAQHSVLVANHLRKSHSSEVALYGLLHDGSEAYLLDLARPVKQSEEMAAYRAAEARLQRVIYSAFSLCDGDEPQAVKEADFLVFHAEMRDLMFGADPKHAELAGNFPKITPVSPEVAKAMFIDCLRSLHTADLEARGYRV